MKKWLKRIVPEPRRILASRQLSVFGKRLQEPSLWHINRRSASGAFAVGLFVMYMPPVGQMLMAAAAAIALRVNLPIAAALVWITNPITIPPMFYFAYAVGCWMLGETPKGFDVQFWIDWHNWLAVLKPLTLGMTVCATLCAAAGYLGVQALWRWSQLQLRRRRRARYRAKVAPVSAPAMAPESGPSTPSSSRQT